MEITSQRVEMTFSLEKEEGKDTEEVVDAFKYLGQILDRSEDDFPAVRQ